MAPIWKTILPLFLTLFSPHTAAARSGSMARETGQAFATFIYPTGEGNLTFSLTTVKSTGDAYIYISAPAAYQWVGVGTGENMDGSAMWILYESSQKDNITLSPRTGDGHVEPDYSSSLSSQCTMVDSSDSQNAIVTVSSKRYYSANIHCKNLTSFGSDEGKLDLKKSKQTFLYGWGPSDQSLKSSSPTAGLRRHEDYGNFWVDMTKATANDDEEAAVPSGSALTTTTNAGADGDATSDGDKVGPAHAVLMLVSFAVLFPLGAVLLRYLNSVKVHGIVQTVGTGAAVVGVGVGLYLSNMYNHSKNVSSGHQVFGLIIVIMALIQFSIGLFHHLQYRKHSRPTIFGKIHLYFGPCVVIGGIINGFIGFNFSGEPKNNIYYGVVVGVILVVVIGMLGYKRSAARKTQKDIEMEHQTLRYADSN